MVIRTAVIPAAGMGTRFLRATRATPKELLPIYDTPALQYVIDEAVAAGFTKVIVVTSHNKPSIESYVKAASTATTEVSVVFQQAPRGLGDAISCARHAVGDEPFAVMLPDEIMGDNSLLTKLIEIYQKTGKTTIALKQVPMNEVFAYGNVAVDKHSEPDVISINAVVEKPSNPVSDLVIIGRYVFAPVVFEYLAKLAPNESGEVQLTDALAELATSDDLLGVVSQITRFDTGTPMGLLRASVEMTLSRQDVGPEFKSWLQTK